MRGLLAAIFRGLSWKLGADIVGRLLQYILLWVAAGSLGRAGFGDFTFALSTGYMFAQVADFGLQLYVQRELARLVIPGATAALYFTDARAAGRLVGGGLTIKLGLSVVALSLIALLVWVEPVGNKSALLLVGLSMVLATGLDYLSYCFRALGRLKEEAVLIVTARVVNLTIGLGLLALGAGVLGLAIAGNVAVGLALLVGYRRLSRYVRPLWRLDISYWRRSFRQPTAVGIGVIFSIISFRVDNLIIPPLAGREALGDYNLAYKLFEPSLIVPSVLLAALFPLLSQAAGGSTGDASQARDQARELKPLVGQTISILFWFGALATLTLALLAVPIVNLLYGEQYVASGPLLQILALSCLPMYLNYGLTHMLIAMDRPQLYAFFTLGALVVNVASNMVLIPLMGVQGAAFATLGTEMALLVMCAIAVPRLAARLPSSTREPGMGGSL
ncbi:MAG: flippase [Chloroflexia bacterium]